MKWTYLIILSLVVISGANAQVAINETGASPEPSAILDISSTDKGVLIPRITTTQRSAIGTTESGLLVYDIDTESFWYYDNTQSDWVELSSATSDDWTISGNNLYSAVSGNVGIGTTNPSSKLDIRNGNLSLISQNADAYIKLLSDEEADITPAYIWSENAKGFAVGGSPGTPQLLVNASTGKVGIGTSNPHQKLTIRDGNISMVSEGSDSYIYLGSNELANSIGSYLWTDDNVGFSIGSTQGVPQMVVNNTNGNVGIGTNNPGTKLEVAGQIKITGGSPGTGKILTTDADGIASWENNTAASEINGLSDGISDNTNLFLGSYTGAQDNGDNRNTSVGINSFYWNVGGKNNTSLGYKSMYRNTSGSSNTAIGNNALYFNTVKSNLVAIGDSALYYNGNNGPTSSQAILNTAVGSKAMLNNTIGHNNTSVGSNSLYSNTTGFHNVGFGYASLESNIVGSYNTATGSFSASLNTGGSNNVSLGYGADYYNESGSGNVILGAHAGRGTSGNSKSGNIFIGYKAGYSEAGSNKLYINNSESTTPLIYGDFSTSQLKINGNLDVEKINPAQQLQVLGSSTLSSLLISPQGNSQNDSELLLGEDDNFTYGMSLKYDGGDNRLYFYGKDSQDTLGSHFTIERDGNIGIGTSSPIGNFHVNDPNNTNNIMYITPGTDTFGDSATLFLAEDKNASSGMYWMFDGTTNDMGLYGKNSNLFYGPHLLIDRATGNIAIGGKNFATGYKLSVEGKVICEEVRVSLQADWPDYVFADDYKLMSVKELEDFVNVYGHLPNIPSSEEMDESGLEVGEMQRLMMEKIEELTLYIINQNKEIKNLKSQIENIKK